MHNSSLFWRKAQIFQIQYSPSLLALDQNICNFIKEKEVASFREIITQYQSQIKSSEFYSGQEGSGNGRFS